MKKIANYINGKHHAPANGQYLDNYDPSTGEVYSQIPDSGAADVEAAVEAAQKALPGWSVCGVEKRYRVMNKMADLIAEKKEMLAQAESRDSGKAISLSRSVDIPRAEANIRFFATAILHFSSSSHYMERVAVNYTLRQPIGVVGCISPWNLPLYLFTWKIAPALAAGNCVVAKPSELTPMTAFLLSEIASEAGLPPGVLNIVHGLGPKAGQAIVEHPFIKAISFTGGTATGKRIAATAAPMFKKLSLELGGKNPNIIFADCDFEEAINTTVRSSFANNGQICLCGSRIYIERPIYERFRDQLIRRANALQIGNPFDEATDQGA
ncbi:MAG TPA: aldehyde dehydrogenase family protein, partial [Bacteroidetes bacterium]|nr:aldehyde dehydrogenase family protein [Bacteroidota bacterium]